MPVYLHPQAVANCQVPNASKRIRVIDALRGITLFGILIIHSTASFMEVLEASFNPELSSVLDKIVRKSVGNLFSNTLYSIFSFLFGLSFAIQLKNSLSKKKSFNLLFIWRLIILLLIGYCHSLFFDRDILQLYALLGLLLVLCAKLKSNVLLTLSFSLFMISLICIFYNAEISVIIVPLGEFARESNFFRLLGLHKFDSQVLTGRLFSTASLFLLGLYAGRKKVFEDNTENHRIFWKMLYASLSIVIIIFVLYKILQAAEVHEYATDTVFAVEKIAQSFFYVAVIVKLYQIRAFNKVANWLVPMGKMGLTAYITQSLFIITFYSLDPLVITQIGLTGALGITIIFFISQLLFASLWMSRYRYGPLEWLWRSITYLKWQPI